MAVHSVWKSSKMSHLNFWILALKSDRSVNTVWLNSSGIQKLTKVIILGIIETFSMIFKHHGVLILELIYFEYFALKSYLERPMFHVTLDGGIFKLPSNQSFGIWKNEAIIWIIWAQLLAISLEMIWTFTSAVSRLGEKALLFNYPHMSHD